jgi:signal transduction histidine kinase
MPGNPSVWIPIALCALALPSTSSGQTSGPEQSHLATLTDAHQAHSLTPEEAAKNYPVRLSGVVTYYDPFLDPRHPALWVSDSSGGIYVALASLPATPYQNGDLVEISGVSAPGGYAPVVNASEVRVTGKARSPLQAIRVTFADMLSGSVDGRWVEVEGIVQGVRQAGRNTDLDLALSDGSLMASTVNQSIGDFTDLMDAKVKVRGNDAPLFNRQGSMTGAFLLFPGRSEIEVEEPGSPLPFDLPILPIGQLLRFTPKPRSGHRVHIRGVVTLAWAGRFVCIEENSLGLCAQTDQPATLAPGQVADVVGFPQMGAFMPTLARATYRATGLQQSVAPASITIRQVVGGDYDARLVELEGEVVGQNDAAADPNITLIAHNQAFSVVLPQDYRHQFPGWKLGSTLKVVGICSVRNSMDRIPVWHGPSSTESIQIRLRSLQDVVVTKQPTWWTPVHAVAMLACGALLTSLSAGWVLILRKRVDQQTFVIQQQLWKTEKLGREVQRLNHDLEKKIAERTTELKTANHELEAFSYSVSHDLRTPLRHIAGFSRILLNDFASTLPKDASNHLLRIHDAVTRTGLLVDALLSLAKLGKRSLKLSETDLNPIVERAITFLTNECAGRNVEWRVARLPAVVCDETLVALIFQNLLGNAVKYSRGREHAVIEVGAIETPNEGTALFVRDNGVGFDMSHAGKLFGVFQRLHTEAEFEGTGVGLATAHRIVHRHGGKIWAEAEIGKGATFYFTLGDTKSTQSQSDAVTTAT